MHPQLRFLFHLAVLDAAHTVGFLEILGVVVDTAIEHFENMPAKTTAKWFGDDTQLHAIHDFFEFRHECSRSRPAHVTAAIGRPGVVGKQFGDLAEILTFAESFNRIIETLFCRFVIDDLIRRYQDVSNLDLVDLATLDGATQVVDLDDVVAACTAEGFGDGTRFKIHDDIGIDRRQLVALHPAECTAFKRRLCAGVADRHLTEVSAVL